MNKRPAMIFIFITLLIDVTGLGIIIPVMPKLISELSGIPLKRITGGTYTGVAATWQRSTLANAHAFVVELGPTLSSAQVTLNAKAALDVAVLLGTLKKE